MVKNLFKAFFEALSGFWEYRWRLIAWRGGANKENHLVLNSRSLEVVSLSLYKSYVAPRGSRDTSCQGDRLVFLLAALFMLG